MGPKNRQGTREEAWPLLGREKYFWSARIALTSLSVAKDGGSLKDIAHTMPDPTGQHLARVTGAQTTATLCRLDLPGTG